MAGRLPSSSTCTVSFDPGQFMLSAAMAVGSTMSTGSAGQAGRAGRKGKEVWAGTRGMSFRQAGRMAGKACKWQGREGKARQAAMAGLRRGAGT